MLGPLYMLMGDVNGALASFDWYEETYPDDSGDPYQYLTWALALFRGGRRQDAFNKLYQTMLKNLYLVPFLLGEYPKPLDIWHGSNLEWIEYAVEVPQELLNLWDDVALQWARDVSEHPAVVEKVARYIAIHRDLSKTKPSANRAAAAFRIAAFGLFNSKSAMGAYYRRQRARLGSPKAITATAHKLARTFYSMLKNGSEYVDQGQDYYEKQYRDRAMQWSPTGAHYLLQTRTAVLNGELRDYFEEWHPELKVGEKALESHLERPKAA